MTRIKNNHIPDEFKSGIKVTDTLDLHGFFPEQIPEVVKNFIENARDLHLKTLRIVHGKGKSRLKYEVHRELKRSPQVKRFYDALPGSGGWGVTIVELQ